MPTNECRRGPFNPFDDSEVLNMTAQTQRVRVFCGSTLGRFMAVAAGTVTGLFMASTVPAIAAPDEPITCPYALSPVQLVTVSGVVMVTTSLPPAQCRGRANSIHTSACLNAEGSGTPGVCQRATGQNTAHVFYSPYRPGTTYVATGAGCATGIQPVQSYCSSVGPLTVTL